MSELDCAYAPALVAAVLVEVVGLTPGDLSLATGANVRTVSSWLDPEKPSIKKEEHKVRLRGLKEVARFLIADGTISYQEADWLRDPNRSADFNTPLKIIGEGRWKEAIRLYCDDVAIEAPRNFAPERRVTKDPEAAGARHRGR